MTSTLPKEPKPGDIATPDGKIMCRDLELHEFGYFTVSYEQAQIARQYGWGCRAGVVLDGEHDDEWSWEHAEEASQCDREWRRATPRSHLSRITGLLPDRDAAVMPA